MMRSYLWLIAAAIAACALVGYLAGCGEVEVGHVHEHAHEHAEEGHEGEPPQAPELPAEATMEELEQAAEAFASGDLGTAGNAVEVLSKAYAISTGDVKLRAGEILADNAMNNPNPDLRAMAIQSMGGDPYDALHVAIEVSKDKVPSVVAVACGVLAGAVGNIEAKQRLEVLSKSSDQEIKAAATRALTAWYHRGGGKGLVELTGFLGDPKGDASAQAAMKLHQSGAKALPVVIGTLESSKNPRARAAAAITLACICAGTNPRQAEFAEAARATTEQPVSRPANLKGLQPMIKALRNDPDPYVREACAQGLGYLGHEACAKPLAEALKDPDASVRRRAASALVTVPAKQVQSELEEALVHDSSAGVRRYAAEALTWIGGSSIVPALMAAIGDPSPEVRRYVAEALGKLGDQRATSALVQLFDDPDEDVRWAAVEAQSKLVDPAAQEALLEAMRDPSPMVATAAEHALHKLGIAKRRGLHLKAE